MRLCATLRTQDAKMVQVQSQSYSLDLAGTHSRDASNCDLRNRCEACCDGLPPLATAAGDGCWQAVVCNHFVEVSAD